MEQKKSSFFKKFSIVYLTGMGLYILGSVLLRGTNLEYRMWVSVLGGCALFLGLPVGLFLVWFRWHARKGGSRVFRYVVTAVLAIFFLLWGYFVFLGMVFGIQEERKLFDGYVVVNRAPALSESQYDLCKIKGFFFRGEAEWNTGFEVAYLERKYRQDFIEVPFDREAMLFYDQNSGGIRYQRTVPVSSAHPNLPVNVVLAGGNLDDDYVDLVTRWYVVEGLKKLGIDRAYQIEEDGNLRLYFADGEAMRDIAADMEKLMDYAAQDVLFEEYAGTIRLAPEDAEPFECIYISFGKTNTTYGQDNELLEPYIELCYEKMLESREERKKTEEAWESGQNAGNGAKEDTEAENGAIEDMEAENGEYSEEGEAAGEQTVENVIPEGEVRQVLEEIRASRDIGENATVEYSAKGDEYYALGEDGTYSYTLLYDRDSKNGACSLYVLYRSPYDAENGTYYHYTDTMTQIVDIYAVVKRTGEVISSGRESWSDPGSREYRKATGE